MSIRFDIEKITTQLEQYKTNLPTLYKWKVTLDKLNSLQAHSETQATTINELRPKKKEHLLKRKAFH